MFYRTKLSQIGHKWNLKIEKLGKGAKVLGGHLENQHLLEGCLLQTYEMEPNHNLTMASCVVLTQTRQKWNIFDASKIRPP